MKKIFARVIAIFLVLIMCFAFAACNKKADEKKDDSKNNSLTNTTATKDSQKPDKDETSVAKTITETVMNAMWVEFDAEKAYSYMHEAAINKTCEATELSREEYMALLQESLDETKKDMEEANGSVQWKITGEKPLDETLLAELKDLYSEISLEIEEATVVMVENRVYEGEEEIGFYVQEITYAKIDNEWYLVDFGAI